MTCMIVIRTDIFKNRFEACLKYKKRDGTKRLGWESEKQCMKERICNLMKQMNRIAYTFRLYHPWSGSKIKKYKNWV